MRLSSSLGRELEELCLGNIDLTLDIDDKKEHLQAQQLNQDQTSLNNSNSNNNNSSLNIVDLSHYESQIASINTDLKMFMSEHESEDKGDLDGGLNKILSELVELTNSNNNGPDELNAVPVNFNFDFLDGYVVSNETNQLIENSGLVQQDMSEIQTFDYELQESMINHNNDPMLFANNGLVAMATANIY